MHVKEKDIPRLQAKCEAGGRKWEALIDGRYGHPLKVNSAVRQWMYDRKKEDESLTAGELAKELFAKFQIDLSVGQVNYLLRKVELTRPRGRPPKKKKAEAEPSPGPVATIGESTGAPEPETRVEGNEKSVEHAGLFFPGGGKAGDGSGG